MKKHLYWILLLGFYASGQTVYKMSELCIELNKPYTQSDCTACFDAAMAETVNLPNDFELHVDYVPGSNGVWNKAESFFFRSENVSQENGRSIAISHSGKLIFDEGVKFKAIGEYEAADGQPFNMLLRMGFVDNWTISGYGAEFNMRDATFTAGEAAHAFGLYDSNNVTFEGFHIDGNGGDGVYLGTRDGPGGGYSSNIVLKNLYIENSRRQGASLISVDGLIVKGCVFTKTGAIRSVWPDERPPLSGADFEMDYSQQKFKGVRVTDCQFTKNDFAGILWAIAKTDSNTEPIDAIFDRYLVEDNWKNSTFTFPDNYWSPPDSDSNPDPHRYQQGAIVNGIGGGAFNATKGTVIYKNGLIADFKHTGIRLLSHHDGIKVHHFNTFIENLSNENNNSLRSSGNYPIQSQRYGSGDYAIGGPDLGNWTFDGLTVVDETDIPVFALEGGGTGWEVTDFEWLDVTVANAAINTATYKAIQTNGNFTGIWNPNNTTNNIQPETLYNTLPTTTINVVADTPTVTRGASTAFTISRSSNISHVQFVRYNFSTDETNILAKERDDFDGKTGVAIIPAGESSVKVDIETRVKTDKDEVVRINILPEPYYTIGASGTASLTIISSSNSTCSNGVQDGDETDIDCGGSCAPCNVEEEIWLEAECAIIGANWVTVDDVNTSNGQYLMTPTVSGGASSTPPDVANITSFDFEAEGGTYEFYAHLLVPDTDKDSYLVSINNGTWFRWNEIVGTGGNFQWRRLHEGEQPTNVYDVSLVNGTNNIRIAHRENGVGLDKIYLSNFNSTNAPSGIGDLGSNCNMGDTTPPAVTNLEITNVTETSFTIDWMLDEGSTGRVEWGPTSSLGNQTTLESNFLTHHIQTVSGLTVATEYFYRVIGEDEFGNAFVGITNSAFTLTPPIADAGSDQEITTPTNSIVLTGSGSDPDGGEVNYQWSQISGPNTATLVGDTTFEVQASDMVVGTYVFLLTVTDDETETDSDEVEVIVSGDATPPTITSLEITNVTETSFTIDWMLDEGSTGRVEWGPSSSLGNQTTLESNFLTHHIQTVSGLTVATEYFYRVIGEDEFGNAFVGDINSVFTLSPPIADAGSDQDITAPTNNIVLTGSGSDPDGGEVSYQWSQISGPNTAILVGDSTFELQVNALVVGVYVFRLTVTDDEGETNFDEVNVTVTGSSPSNQIWLEAECAQVGSNWSVVADSGSSGGQYLLPPLTNHTSSPPVDSESILSFNFSAVAGTYKIHGLVQAPDGNHDSFWVRANGGTWVKWNVIELSPTFIWDEVHDQPDSIVPVSFTLVDGNNTIDFANRESGISLDKIYITSQGDSPSGIGGMATNCSANQAPTNILPENEILVPENSTDYPILLSTVDADSGDAHTYTKVAGIDSDLFNLSGNILTLNFTPDFENPIDSNSNGLYGVYITTDDGNGGTFTKLLSIEVTDIVNEVVVCQNPAPRSTIVVESITASSSDGSDICNVVDDNLNTSWASGSTGSGDWIAFRIEAGIIFNSMEIAFQNTDQNTRTYNLEISNDNGNTWQTIRTNSVTGTTALEAHYFNPIFYVQDVRIISTGGFSLGNVSELRFKTSDGSSPTLEAECAIVGADWTVSTDSNASNGEYLTPPNSNNFDEPVSPAVSSIVRFDFLANRGEYRMYGRVQAPTGNNDSFWVRANGTGSWIKWNLIESSSTFIWDELHDQPGSGAPISASLNLEDGYNYIEFVNREIGTLLDKIYLTSIGNPVTPTGLGYDASNCDQNGSSSKSSSLGLTKESTITPSVDLLNVEEIALYPNPSDDLVTIDIPTTSEITSYYMYSISGKLVKNGSVDSGQTKLIINVQGEEEGLYIIELEHQNGEKTYMKLMKE